MISDETMNFKVERDKNNRTIMSVANITTYSLIALLPYSLKKEKKHD